MTTKKAKTTKAKAAKVEEKTTATPEIKNEETKVEETSTDTFKHIVSEEDLQNNPELKEDGLKAGDEIELSGDEINQGGTDVSTEKESAVETQEIVEEPKEKAPANKKESKAIYYNRKFNGEFKKLENPLSLEDLKQRKSLPTDVSLKDSEFLFEDGSVYNIGQQGFINKDGKSLLDNLK